MKTQTEQTQEEYEAKKQFLNKATTVAEVEAQHRTAGMEPRSFAAQESARTKLAKLVHLHHCISKEADNKAKRHYLASTELQALLDSLPSKLSHDADQGLSRLISLAAP